MIKKFKTIKQHYVKSLINFDQYDNIVEQIIKERLGNGNRRRQEDSQDTKKNGGFIRESEYNKMKYKPTNRGKKIDKKGPYEI
jgi:hypothetical protein